MAANDCSLVARWDISYLFKARDHKLANHGWRSTYRYIYNNNIYLVLSGRNSIASGGCRLPELDPHIR